MTQHGIESKLRELSERLRFAVDPRTLSMIEDFLYYTEWECALSALWGSLSESGEVLEKGDYEALVAVGAGMGIDPESAYRNYPILHR